MHRSNVRLFAVAALAAVALAACSSSSKPASSSTIPPTNAPTPTTAAPSATTTPVTAGAPTASTISVVKNSKYGNILVDSKGMTVYVDENDKPGKPACTGACLSAWPPVPAPASPTFGAGLDASKYTTVTAADGTKQLAVNGSPLYTWSQDSNPGDATGQDVNGFYVVMTNGVKYDPGAASGS